MCAVKALKKTIGDKAVVEDDYKKVSEQLGISTRQKVEIQEKLKVTEEVLKALEIDHEEKEELDLRRKSDNDNYEVTIEDDEENFVEDIETGQLYPTKVARIVKVSPVPKNVCKKCDKKISEEEGMMNHMKSHKRSEKEIIKCDQCNFETHDGDILLNHISQTHIKFHICLTCKMTFMNTNDLIGHAMKVHTLVKSNIDTDKCAVCSEEFISVNALISHILRIHSLVNEETLATTEAGHQLVKVWPNESESTFKCYDCGQGVNERGDLIKHKREKHYKQKNCKSYHQNHYCRFIAIECIYIHRPEERQWQNQGQQPGQAAQQSYQQYNIQAGGLAACRNGPRCLWLASNRCKFGHEASTVQNAAQSQNQNVPNAPANNANSVTSTSTSETTTLETCMKAIMDRLGQLETRMPPVRNLTGFPPLEGEKKSQ